MIEAHNQPQMNWLIDFLDSTFFLAVVTLIVGTGALVVYLLQKRAYKQDAARVVLTELQAAQRQLKVVKKHLKEFKAKHGTGLDVDMVPENVKLMANASWNQYKYLFVRDLNRDNWDAVSDFYENSQRYDTAVDYNKDGFRENGDQIRRVSSDAAMSVLKDFVIANPGNIPGSTEEQEAIKTASEMQRILLRGLKGNDIADYRPQKPISDATTILSLLNGNDLSLAILKLQKISKTKD